MTVQDGWQFCSLHHDAQEMRSKVRMQEHDSHYFEEVQEKKLVEQEKHQSASWTCALKVLKKKKEPVKFIKRNSVVLSYFKSIIWLHYSGLEVYLLTGNGSQAVMVWVFHMEVQQQVFHLRVGLMEVHQDLQFHMETNQKNNHQCIGLYEYGNITIENPVKMTQLLNYIVFTSTYWTHEGYTKMTKILVDSINKERNKERAREGIEQNKSCPLHSAVVLHNMS